MEQSKQIANTPVKKSLTLVRSTSTSNFIQARQIPDIQTIEFLNQPISSIGDAHSKTSRNHLQLSRILKNSSEQSQLNNTIGSQLLTQRLYGRYNRNTGSIIPNELVNPAQPSMLFRDVTQLQGMTTPLKRSNSVLQRIQSSERTIQYQEEKTTNQSSIRGNEEFSAKRKIKVLLPKIASVKDLKLETISSIPVLPFPRVYGAEVISPFKKGDGNLTQRFKALQSQETHVDDSQISRTLPRIRSQSKVGLLQSLRDSNNSTSSSNQLKLFNDPIQNAPYLQQKNPQISKHLAILQMHQAKKLNLQSDFTQDEQVNVQMAQDINKPIVMNRKMKIEVRDYMLAKGLQPTPLNFYKLVSNDKAFYDFFCYCNKKQDFYDFEVVAFNQKNEQEYLTVSQKGLIHFIKGHPQFITIMDWERESNIFGKMKKIPFFSNFKYWKTFGNWKGIMRRTMFSKSSEFLKRELFILDAELSKPLLDMRMKTYQFNKQHMINVYSEIPLSITDFNRLQEKQRKTLAVNIVKIDEDINQLLTESCNVSMRTFKEENRIAITDEFFGGARDDENIGQEAFLVGDETHKQMPYTQEATLKTHFRKLSRYIRLSDHFILDARYKMINNCLLSVLEILQLDFGLGEKHAVNERIQSCALFEIIVDLQKQQIQFNPIANDLCFNIIVAIQTAIQCVKNYKPYLQTPQYDKYAKAVIKEDIFDDDNDLLQLALGSEYLDYESSLIRNIIGMNFQQLQDFTNNYEKYFKLYDQHCSLDVQSTKNYEQDQLHSLVVQLCQQQEEIEKMDVKRTIQIFKINGDDLKTRIKEQANTCIASLKHYIPHIQFDRFHEIYLGLAKDYAKISKRPRRVDDYVSLMNSLRDITEHMDDYTSRFYEAERLLVLMDEHKIRLPERNRTKLRETQALVIDTKKAMVEAFEGSQGYKLSFKKELVEVEVPKLKKKIDEMRAQLQEQGVFESETTPVIEAIAKLDEIGEQVKKAKNRGQQLNQFQKFLDMEETVFESANDIHDDWQGKYSLWSGMHQWSQISQEWLLTKFVDIDVEALTSKVETFHKMACVCHINLKGNQMASNFKRIVENLKATIPVVTYLRDPSLEPRHWEEIFSTLNMRIDLSDESFTLNSLLDLNVMSAKEKLEEISMKARQEKDLEIQIEKLISDWKKAVFDTKQHKDQYFIIVPNEQLNADLEEALQQLAKMLSMRFIDRVRNETEVLYKKLQYFENLLNEWLNFQRSWMYLENIFNSVDIASKMGQDSKKFFQVDHQWKEIMKYTHQNPLISRVTAGYNQVFQPGTNIFIMQSHQINFLEVFKESNRILDDIQRSLEILLERKRNEFPRFYFISNDELLQILSQASRNPLYVEIHLKKLFENIVRITLDGDDVVEISSAEGECFKIKRVKALGIPVERWLQNLLESMMQMVKRSIKDAKTNFREDQEDFKRVEWIMEDYPAQSISLVSSICWCSTTEQILQVDNDDETLEGLDWWNAENVKQLAELTKIITKTNLEPKKRRAIVALITQDVHYRDIVDSLRKISFHSSVSTNDFQWQQQLRYYLDNDQDVSIRQVNAKFEYGYEYLGATTRIVITPLTDRCWLTITGALHLKLGAAPSGPAGTGKTESTKDLSKALGKYCVVFNCSDQINFKMMESLFFGLAMTGSWICLDEFNRINIEVLSVIAQQVLAIRNALLSGRTSEVFIGEKKLDKFFPTLGIFITMNPGYKGRTELPDNLKVLFRPVSMMIPDYTLIAEIMLFSEGFQSGKVLSKKMTRLYKLASEQLSQQSHYDFGMRAVKSVLTMAGQLKRSNPKVPEDTLLMKAMKDANIPKFIKEDLPLFYAIINDLFPNSPHDMQRDSQLIKVIENCQVSLGLTPSEPQTEKIMQLIDTMSVRFGIMIIGQTLTGKSCIIKSLKEVHNSQREQAVEGWVGAESYILNPKSIALSDLYGNFSHITHEWTDGLASSIIRQSVETTSQAMQWIVFDGPVDAIWVENMNTVLDDNMTLCLSNGERIKLKTDMRILFEIDDLSQASPATVSRCGMVYASQQSLSWRPIVASWLKQLPGKVIGDKNKENVWNLFDTHIDNTLELFRVKKYSQVIPVTENNQVITLFRMIESILSSDFSLRSFSAERQKKVLTKVFSYCLAWAFGGSIDIKNHSSFEVYLSNALSSTSNELPRASIFDTYLMLTGQGTPEMMIDYQLWTKIVPNELPFDSKPGNFSNQELIVPTKDTTRFSWIMKTHMQCGFPVFLTGMTGVGKSLISGYTLNRMEKIKGIQVINLSFSSQTSAMETQTKIEDKLEKKKRNLLGGNKNQPVIVFVDDVNMPAYDKYSAQMPIELLRLFLDHKGFYDIDELYWKNIQNISMLCAAAPPEGGRKVLTQRFTSHFSMFGIPHTQEDSLQKIFGTILESKLTCFNGFRKEVVHQVHRTVESTLVLYFKIVEGLKPTPQKQHYTFNLRDIQRVIGGICSTKSSVVNSVEKLSKLWVHETSRVFIDRLVTNEDRLWLQNQIVLVLQGTLRYDCTYDQIFGEANQIFFTDIMQRGLPFEDRNYSFVQDHKRLQSVIQDYVEEYNLLYPGLAIDLVLFDSCLDQILRVCRVLRQPRSHGLIVGVSGCGKQSVSRLGTFMSQCLFFSINSKSNKITLSDFRDSIKKAMVQSGTKNKRSVFMLTDYQINACATKDEVFLEDISNLLNSGETLSLWTREDKEDIYRALKKEAAEYGIYDNIFETFFHQRMKINLHFLICMSPIGESFRNRLRMFPSLINCCQMSWFNEWPKEALYSVAMKFIEKIEQITDESTRMKLAKLGVNLNEAVKQECEFYYQEQRRRVYLTPASYLDFLKAYLYLMNSQEKTQSLRKNTLIIGSEKLKKTKDIVEELTANMIKMQPMLQQSIADTEVMGRKIEREKYEASQNRKSVEQEKRIVDKQNEEVQNQYNLALQELNQVLPALIEAEDALNTLNQSDIVELRQTKSPSKGILNTMIATYILLEKKIDYRKIDWKACQQMMSVGFFDKLKSFDKDELVKNEKLNHIIENFMQENPDFQPEIVKNSSKACYSLCKWCFALKNYAKIAQQVQPKQQMVAVMEQELKKAQLELALKQTKLMEEMKKLELLEKKYQEITDRGQNLETEIELCHVRILRSNKLTEGLKGENERWKECLITLNEETQYLVAEVFLAATTISYLGPFSGINRKKITDQVKKELRDFGIPFSQEQKGIEDIVSDPLEIQNWRICGLPSDWVSISNAAIATKSLKVPLIIDPQQQGIKWIKSMNNKGSTLDNPLLYDARLGTKEFETIAEIAMQRGKSLLIEDVGSSLDAILDPMILKQFYKGLHGRNQINFCGQVMDYDPSFKLYLSMRDPNPHLLPEVYMKLTVINFTVTQEGLAEQLLVDIVRLENEELESRRVQLSQSIASDQVRMVKIQEDILLKLVNSSEDTILDDENLIEHLDMSKIMSEDIKKAIDYKNQAQQEIIRQRMIYEELAERGSILYFSIFDLSKIETMYQHSLDQFKRLFVQIIKDQPQMQNQTKKISILMREILRVIYKFVCRGLFHDDKLIFALIIAIRISLSKKLLSIQEFDLFLKGSAFVGGPPQGLIQQFKQPLPQYISDSQWKFILSLEVSHPFFTGLAKSFEIDLEQWIYWKSSREFGQMPGDWEVRLTQFQKMLVVKCLRQQNLIDQIKQYVMKELGNEFINLQLTNLEEVHQNSDCKTPITFILSQGADPTAQFLQLHQKIKYRSSQTNGFEQQLFIISLGQGQDKYAISCLDKAQKRGQWIILQNCHLYESFMPILERIVVTMPEKCHEFHQDFRLFLTSLPSEFFPSSILQSSIKVAFEAAKGIKANLFSSISRIEPIIDQLSGDFTTEILKKTLVIQYSLCFFHAVVQERRKFGALGWNIPYEFNESDFDTGVSIIRDMMSEEATDNGEYIMWDSIQQVIGEVVYGGRVTDEIDRKTLKFILKNFISEDVLSKDYSYSESGMYRPIAMNNIDDMLKEIESLPENDLPEIFGMNEIADLTCNLANSQKILNSLLLIQPRQFQQTDQRQGDRTISTVNTQEQQVEQIVIKIQQNMPKLLSREGSNKEMFSVVKEGQLSSMSVFLLHEVDRFNTLIKVIETTLDTLCKAIKGQAVMSEEIEQMYQSLLINKVPEIWAQRAYPSLKPLSSWIINLKDRVDFIRNWLISGCNILGYWLPAFFFPQGFLTSILQNYARRTKAPIDTLSFSYEVLSIYSLNEMTKLHPQVKNQALILETVLIYGLYLASGFINPKSLYLDDAPSTNEKHSHEAQIIAFRPVIVSENNISSDLKKQYTCPLYKTSERAGTLSTTGHSTNFIINVDLPSARDPSYWILRGTALLCELDN